MISSYKILLGYGETIEKARSALVIDADVHVKHGWQPQGGVEYCGTEFEMGTLQHVFAQALVKGVEYDKELWEGAVGEREA